MTKQFPSLVHELREGLVKRVTLAVLAIALIGMGLHIAWTFQARRDFRTRLKQAVAHTLQEPVRNRDLITMRRTLQAFTLANGNVSICVKLPGGTLLAHPDCSAPDFESFTVPLSSESFEISVKRPLLDLMSLAGLPFVFAVAILLLMVSIYLRKLAHNITQDLSSLAIDPDMPTPMFLELRTARDKIQEGLKLQTQAAVGEMASQVAHDIRSPLAALEVISQHLEEMPEDRRLLLRQAIGRIRGIANNLLDRKARESAVYSYSPRGLSVELLPTLVGSLISEKREQYRSHPGIEFEVVPSSDDYGMFVQVQPVEFARVLSNLINNAVEAMGSSGRVSVRLASDENSFIQVEVADNGKGIPPEIQPRLMQRGETHGKAGGLGLGLAHARESLESWGGSIALASQIGIGTTITLRLPRAQAPIWYIDRLEIEKGGPVVVLDDDPSTHEIWNCRIDQTSEKLVHCYSSQALKEWLELHAEESTRAIYLIDYELGEKATGLEAILTLNLSSQAVLVTSQADEPEFRQYCEQERVRMIPKGMAPFVPIAIRAPRSSRDTLHINSL